MGKRRYSLTLNRCKRRRLEHAALPEQNENESTQPSQASPAEKTCLSTQREVHVTPESSSIPHLSPTAPKPNRTFNHRRKKLFRSPKATSAKLKQIKDWEIIQEGLSILKLSSSELYQDFVSFFRLIASDQYPLDNISLLLFLDTVRWYSSEIICRMRFREECVRFTLVGWMLFGGQFVRFLQGSRFHGQLCDNAERLEPKNSGINFAVPSENSLREKLTNNNSILRNVQPGLLPTIESIALSPTGKSKRYVLAIDGKKVAMGLTPDTGDVNMFGFEDQPKFEDRKQQLQDDLNQVSKPESDLQETPMPSLIVQADIFKALFVTITRRLREVRELYVKKDHALVKFKKLGGDNWRTSKYLYVISSMQTTLHQMREFSASTMVCLENMCKEMIHIHKISKEPNWFELKSPDELPDARRAPEFIKQGTQEWLDLRKLAPVTGSSMYDALGQRTLKAMKIHMDKVQGKNIPPHSQEVEERMEYGRRNEVNAQATLVGRVISVWYPHLQLVDEGAHFIKGEAGPLVEVSPDGSLRNMVDGQPGIPAVAVELKCPNPNVPFRTPVPYSFPRWYVLQVLCEMKALGVDKLVFLSWTPVSSTVFEVQFCSETWNQAWDLTKQLYGGKITRPSRLPQECKDLQKSIQTFVTCKTRLLGEVPSLEATPRLIEMTTPDSPYIWSMPRDTSVGDHQLRVEEKLALLSSTRKVVKESYQLARTKASEMVLFMLSDTDRFHSVEMPYAVPIAYGMKASSMGTEAMREAAMCVVNKCKDQGINVSCMSFDGQFLKLAVRDCENKPLTLFQVQRDVWLEVRKMPKAELVRKIKHLYEADHFLWERRETGIDVRSSDGGLPFVRARVLCFSSQGQKGQRHVVDDGDCNNNIQTVEEHNTETEQSVDNGQHLEGTLLPGLGDLMYYCEEVEVQTSTDHVEWTLEDIEHLPPELLGLSDEVVDNYERLISEPMYCPGDVELSNNMTEHDIGETLPIANASSTDQSTAEETDTLSFSEDITKTQTLYNTMHIQSKNCSKLSLEEFGDVISNKDACTKLTHSDLNMALNILQCEWKKSWKKEKKICALVACINGQCDKTYNPKTLKILCKDIVSDKTFPKEALNAGYAGWTFHHRELAWKDAALIKGDITVNGKPEKVDYISQPELHRGELLFKCVDGHHIFVNLRASICRDALKGIRREAFERVAKQGQTKLNIAIVSDGIDKQSNALARTMFSKEVEECLEKNGDLVEAKFCQLIRGWYEAEDDAGISAEQRHQQRTHFREYLLSGMHFNLFPPAGMHIKGMSKVSYEALLSSIDTHTQLYSLEPYNQRAIGSLTCETAFSEVSSMDPTGKGCPKARDVGHIVSRMSFLAQTRLDPSRSFHMRTTKSSVYVSHVTLPVSQMATASAGIPPSVPTLPIEKIHIRDHLFDSKERARHKTQRKKGYVSAPDQPSRGSVPVGYHHRVNEARILPHKRLGIELK